MLLLLGHFICVRPSVTPWTMARQAPLSLGFSRQEDWSGVPSPSPEFTARISNFTLRLTFKKPPLVEFWHYIKEESSQLSEKSSGNTPLFSNYTLVYCWIVFILSNKAKRYKRLSAQMSESRYSFISQSLKSLQNCKAIPFF